MKNWHLINRFTAAIKAFKAYRDPLLVLFQEDIFVASLKKYFKERYGPSEADELLMQDFAQTAVKNLNKLGGKTALEAAVGLENEFLHLMIQKYCLVSGVAALWELEMKFFAAKLGIDVYHDNNPGEHLHTRATGKIVSQIHTKYPRIRADLTNCLEIRNGLIHGNLQQLKVVVSKLLSPEELKEVDPKLASISLSINSLEPSVRMASDSFTKSEASKLGPFFWFLAGGNSRLLDHACRILEQGLSRIRLTISVVGLSFEETKGYFDQLNSGLSWTEEQKTIFEEKRGKYLNVKPELVRDAIDKIHTLFDLG